jgi:lysine 2-monooxygenase
MPTPDRPIDATPYDITIVGAGMAGLYSAWRLLSPAALHSKSIQQLIQKNGTGQLRLCFLEQSDRVGGRLDTYTFNEAGGVEVTVELGGMRFQQSQALVSQVVQALGLQTASFPMTNNRLFYLRSRQIWENEITNPSSPVQLPYTLPPAEQNQTPDALFNTAVSNAVLDPNAPNWTADQWKNFVLTHTYSSPVGPLEVYNNASYTDIGFWNLLYDQVSQEGYRYLTEAGGYDSNTINWNAALAMPYVASGDYSSSASYLRLVGGYSTLPKALQQAISSQLPISLNTTVKGFTNNAGLIDIVTVDGQGKESVFQTKNLMLCMPKRSLELLDPDSEFGTYMRSSNKLASVLRQPSFKLLLLFDQEWWKQVNIRGTGLVPYGPTITDLPLRMIWYFDDPIVRRAGKQEATKYWALLAAYSDMETEQFWASLRDIATGLPPNPPAIPAPPEMINMAMLQLTQVHGMMLPPPIAGVYKDWGLDPYGAGYHAWAAYLSPWTMFADMLKPMSDYNVFVCGEAYSLDQGWVEGALRTAETVLTQYFGLPVLHGVPAEYIERVEPRHGG